MSPTSYQTAPPREVILAESPGSVKPAHAQPDVGRQKFLSLLRFVTSLRYLTSFCYFGPESPVRAAGALRAVIQMTSGGILPKSRQDFAGT